MRINSIQTTTNSNGDFLVIEYIDDNGNQSTIMRSADSDSWDAVKDFIAGKISAEDVIGAFGSHTDNVKRCADTVGGKISRVSEHITTDGRHVYFDGTDMRDIQIDPVLENHLVRLILAHSEDLAGWARFTERLYENVSDDIRNQLVRWLDAQDWLTIDNHGRLVGYRGCAYDHENNTNTPYAVHQGFAIVDGVEVNGSIPNRVGSIIEMPRNRVTHDPQQGCAAGLHVGTYGYAKGWAPADGWLLRVAVNPEDIVSVPYECSSQKIRCCKFEVLDAERKPDTHYEKYHDTLSYHCDDDDYDDDFDDDDYDEDDDFIF